MTQNLRGALLMILAMALFAIEDMCIKLLSSDMSTGQIIAILGGGGAVLVGLVALLTGQRIWTRALLHPAVIGRTLAEVFGTIGFVTALALTPITSASAILQALPLAVTLGAALFLGETVGWRRWSAVGVGFCGVLLVIRPGLDSFEPASLFAVQAVIGLSARDMLTRITPKEVTSPQLSLAAFIGLVPTGLLLMMVMGQAPVALTRDTWALTLAAIVIGVLSYAAIVAATRLGDVAVIAPFRYSRIAFALIIGTLVFGERPDLATLIGAGIIVASGSYALIREARLKQTARRKEAGQASLQRPAKL